MCKPLLFLDLDQYQAGLKLGELMGLGGLDDQDEVPANLPPRQRELFLRIQQQQRQNVPDEQQGGNDQQQGREGLLVYVALLTVILWLLYIYI